MATNTTATTTDKKAASASASDNLILTLPLKGSSYAPFKQAWNTYAAQPQNSSKSNSELLRNIVADAIGFDLSSISFKSRGRADTNGKVLNALMKKAKEINGKQSQIDALAMWMLSMGQDLSDMFTPEEIKRYKEMNANKPDPRHAQVEAALNTTSK